MTTYTHSNLVPVLNTQAGSTLTLANWEQAGIKTLTIHLSELLMKPGLEVLQGLPDIRSFYAWGHRLVLNAVLPFDANRGCYRLRSRYDGSELSIDLKTFLALLVKLKADVVILPPNAQSELKEMQTYDSLSLAAAGSFESLLQKADKMTEKFYLMGNFSYKEMQILASSYKESLIEADQAAQDGSAGLVYSSAGLVDISDLNMREDFDPLDNDCLCEACRLKLSRSYLRYLLQYVPLLAGRFLIQHNICCLRKDFILGENPYMIAC